LAFSITCACEVSSLQVLRIFYTQISGALTGQ
jgi:hypothetical protein